MDEQEALDALRGVWRKEWRDEFIDELLESVDVECLIAPSGDDEPWENGYIEAIETIRETIEKFR